MTYVEQVLLYILQLAVILDPLPHSDFHIYKPRTSMDKDMEEEAYKAVEKVLSGCVSKDRCRREAANAKSKKGDCSSASDD